VHVTKFQNHLAFNGRDDRLRDQAQAVCHRLTPHRSRRRAYRKLVPILDELLREGRKGMIAYRVDRVAELTGQLERRFAEWFGE